MKRIFFLGCLISAAALWFLFQEVEIDEVLAAVGRFRVVFLLPILFLVWLTYLLRDLRWRVLLPGTTPKSFHLVSAGMLAVIVVPFRAGEFFRPWACARISTLKFPSILPSILIERILDLVAVIALLAIQLNQAKEIPVFAQKAGATLGALCLIALAGILVAVYLPGFSEKTLSLIANFFKENLRQKILEFGQQLLSGLEPVRDPIKWLITLLYTAALWGVYAFLYMVFGLSLGMEIDLGGAMLVSTMIALAIAVPSAPGFVGTFQFGCVLALSGVLGFSQAESVAFSIVAHVLQFLGGLAIGIYSFYKLELGLAKFWKEREALA